MAKVRWREAATQPAASFNRKGPAWQSRTPIPNPGKPQRRDRRREGVRSKHLGVCRVSAVESRPEKSSRDATMLRDSTAMDAEVGDGGQFSAPEYISLFRSGKDIPGARLHCSVSIAALRLNCRFRLHIPRSCNRRSSFFTKAPTRCLRRWTCARLMPSADATLAGGQPFST